MKRILTICFLCSIALIAEANLTYDFTGKGSTFDDETAVDVQFTDGGINFTMTVTAVSGGELNSNSGDFGIDNDSLNGTNEVLELTFSEEIDFLWVELGGVGNKASSDRDWANLTVGSEDAIDLYTGVSGFNGTSDVYKPTSSIPVDTTESIVLTGSSASSSFDLEKIKIQAVPEPVAASLIGVGGLLTLGLRRLTCA